MASKQRYCDGMQKMFGRKIPFDPQVRLVIDKGIEETTKMDPEERARIIEIAGYLVFDIMIVVSLGNHKDAKIAKGGKQAVEKFIKGRLNKRTNGSHYEYAKLLEEAKEAAEKEKEKIFKAKKQAVEKASKKEDLKGLGSTGGKLEINRKTVASRYTYGVFLSQSDKIGNIWAWLMAPIFLALQKLLNLRAGMAGIVFFFIVYLLTIS